MTGAALQRKNRTGGHGIVIARMFERLLTHAGVV